MAILHFETPSTHRISSINQSLDMYLNYHLKLKCWIRDNKELILTKITSFHERDLRKDASQNDMMPYFNVSLLGLRGRLHPAITNVTTSHAVKKMRPHIKMLSGN